jgi:hypothetical protein
VVLEVRANAGKVCRHVDAEVAQVPTRPDAREHEQLRRADGAGGHDHLAVRGRGSERSVDRIFDATAGRPLEDEPANVGIGHDGQIQAAGRRGQVGVGRGLPFPVDDRVLVPRRALATAALLSSTGG